MTIQLSDEQKAAVATAMDPGNSIVILTGQAGSGKSTIIRELQKTGVVTVSATTGKAALNVDGITVDKLFGIDRDKWTLFNRGYTDWCMSKCENTVLIDEASMIGERMGKLIYDTCVSYGKRMVLVGDWGQAAPVKDNWPFETQIFKKGVFVKLNECHRQNAGAYLSALNKLRVGTTDDEVNALFSSRAGHADPGKDYLGICMFGTNKAADEYNEKCLREHLEQTGNLPVELVTTLKDVRPRQKQDSKPLTVKEHDKYISDCPFAHGVQVAIGSKVVCTKNDNEEGCYVNGTIGVVEDVIFSTGDKLSDMQADCVEDVVSGNLPRISAILLTSGDADNRFTIRVGRQEANVVDPAGSPQFELQGFPLALGYGVTIHKSQGMTVDRAHLNSRSLASFPVGSRHGLMYVAMSRTRTLEGLTLSDWDPNLVECYEEALPWL